MTRLRAALHRYASVARAVCHHTWRVATGRASLHIEDNEAGLTRFTFCARRKG